MRLAALGVRLVTRRIADGDEAAFPDPSEPLARRRASGAGAARRARSVSPRSAAPPTRRCPARRGGFPLWPRGLRRLARA